jgi:hypothetical protein
MATNWLRRIVKRITGRDIQRERLACKRRPWLFVEPLESRIAPAVITFNVTTTTDGVSTNGPLSLREALIQANDYTVASDDVVINLQAGQTYQIGADRGRFQPFYGDTENTVYDEQYGDFDIRRPMTILGHDSIIDAAGLGRVFDIRVNSGTVDLEHLTVQNGATHYFGNGIYAQGGMTLVLNYVNIDSNQGASEGGGLYADLTSGGQLSMTGGEVWNNTANGFANDGGKGGGVYVTGGQVSIEGSSFRENQVIGQDATEDGAEGRFAWGGGLYANDVRQLTLDNASFRDNYAYGGRGGPNSGHGGSAFGGAVYFVGNLGAINITNSLFDSNDVFAGVGGSTQSLFNFAATGGDGGDGYGGAIAIETIGIPGRTTSVNTTIERSRFSNDLVRAGSGGNVDVNGSGGIGGNAFGGALAFGIANPLTDATALTVTNSTFDTNSAVAGGGGEAGGFSGNGGPGGNGSGGGVYASAGTQTFTDAPFLSNKAVAGDGGRFWNGDGGDGGAAAGGAIASTGGMDLAINGTVTVTGDLTNPDAVRLDGLMRRNLALGGSGGGILVVANDHTFSAAQQGGRGGDGRGGAVAVVGGGRTFQSTDIFYVGNSALAGNGGSGLDASGLPLGVLGGNCGRAYGGAVYSSADTDVTRNAFISNVAAGARYDLLDPNSGTLAGVAPLIGGPGGLGSNGPGLSGGLGGQAYGGAVFVEQRSLYVSASGFTSNQAVGGMGGFGSPGAHFDDRNGGAGGSGNDGGWAWGGAIRAETDQTVSINTSTFVSNFALGGRGGSGGQGGTAGASTSSELAGGRGGDAGNGGNAHGGAISVGGYAHLMSGTTSILDSANLATVVLADLLVVSNQAIAGDAGFAGNGGGGAQDGGEGGRGGSGGVAFGGGVDLVYVNAGVYDSTFQANRAVAGDGAAGGYGGGGNWYGGAGGDGGNGGSVAGAGLAFDGNGSTTFPGQNVGSLTMSRSTVVDNEAIAGNGGNGGFGGPGQYGGDPVKSGGNGGAGGSANGGGVYVASANGSIGTLTNVTVARNRVEAGDGGFGSLGSPITQPDGTPLHVQPFRYQAATPGSVTTGATSVFDLSQNGSSGGIISPKINYDNTATNIGNGGIGADSISAGVPDLTRVYASLAALTGSIATTTSFAAAVGAGASIAGDVVAATKVTDDQIVLVEDTVEAAGDAVDEAAEPVFDAAELAAGLTGALGSSAAAFGAVAAGGAVLSIGVVLITNIIIDGALTGDWEGAVVRTLGTPGEVYPDQFSILLSGVQHNDNVDPPQNRIPGPAGADGAIGQADGAGVYGPLTLIRTAAAENAASQHDFTRTSDGDRFLVSESSTSLAVADVAGGATESGGANETNFIGAVNSAFTNSIHGTTASPLDAKFDTEIGLHGGTMPTLKLLPLSPARQAITNFQGLSQNHYYWNGTADIGAWGGPANRAPVAGTGPSYGVVANAADTTASVGVNYSDLLRSVTDPDGDTLSVVNFQFTPQNGTATPIKDSSGAVVGFSYQPNAGFVGQETFTFQATDGQYTTATITGTINVVPLIKSVQVAAQSGAATYGDATHTVTFDVSALRGGSMDISNAAYSISSTDLPAAVVTAASFSPATVSSSGSDPIPGTTLTLSVPNTLGAGSYHFTVTLTAGSRSASGTGTLTVGQRALTVTASDQAKTYGDAPSLGTTAFTTSVVSAGLGLVNGDTVTGVTLSSAGAAATADVASSAYAITPSSATGTGLGNYQISYASGSLTVNPKALTITADNLTKITGQANPAFTTSYNGFVLGQGPSVLSGALTFTTKATASSAPGTYTITASGLTSTNYAITFVTGTLTVLSYSQASTSLQAQVDTAGLDTGTQSSLDSQLQAAITSFKGGNNKDGVNQLGAFINHVSALKGKKVSAALADAWIAYATQIINVAG